MLILNQVKLTLFSGIQRPQWMCWQERNGLHWTAENRFLPSYCCHCKLSLLPSGFIACATVCNKHGSVLRWILHGLFEWGFWWIRGASIGFWWEESNIGNLPIPQEQLCQLHHLFQYHCPWNWFWHLVLHQMEGCFVFSISWSHWAVSYLNAPVLIGEPEPSRSWHYFVKSVCGRKPRLVSWWLELGF